MMKNISFSLVALLIIVLAAVSAFKTSTVTLPIEEGWHQVQDAKTLAKIGVTGPSLDQQANYDPIYFELSPTQFSALSCGAFNLMLCAVYFNTNGENVLSPESIYYVAGGRP